ncbi:male sterility protein-domain-containing protein [Daedaleopsis nitida]|nr:male sterility protein-domain-containing protein [Daedaleopsis nitida]
MQSTSCSAVFVDSAISHLHADILHKDPASGVTPTIVARPPIATDTTRDGLVRATAFLDKTANVAPALLQKEAAGGAIFLHTSGSTGHPKAIAWSHDFILAISAANGRDRARCNDDVLYTCFPMFHAGGICTSFPFFLGSGASFVCVDAWRSVSVDTILRHLRILKHRKVDASLPPSILEDIADSRDADSVVSIPLRRNTVFWGGAPLRENAGKYLVQNGVRLVAWGGSTEAGPLARSSLEEGADPADWMYMRLVDYYEFNWYPMKGDQHSRCNLIVSPIHATPPIVNSLDPIGFATNDGWLQHPDPDKSHLWKPAGRLDDVVMTANMLTSPTSEELLCASPHIYHAIIFGSGRFINGAIVSPPTSLLKSNSTHDEETAVEKYLDLIWPHIDGHVNKIVPQHSRLLRGMILVARPDRPFLVSDKGTVKTKASLALYTEDIDRAYEALERGMDEGNAQPVNSLTDCLFTSSTDGAEGAVLAFVQEVVADALGHKVWPQDDFFRNGMDSLIATKLRTVLSAAVRRAGIDASVPRNVVYAHPTCDALARFLRTFVEAETSPAGGASVAVPTEADAFKTVDSMITKYTQDLPMHQGTRPVPENADVYAVTGTTGSLGAAYVAHLLEQERVKKIYLLNRAQAGRTMQQRQEAAFLDKGLDAIGLRLAKMQGRVEYVESEVGKPRLGLSDEMYSKLSSELTHIVHNAWLLNFNLFLPSFEPHVAGLRALLDLALSSSLARPPQVAFISSIGAVARWPFSSAAPEAALNSPEFSLPQGYSYSKYVSEQILQRAVWLRSTLRATVIRCGQLSGTVTTGAWAKSEYIPRLLRSADELGIVPTGLAPVRWLPVDVAADILFREVEHAAAQPGPGPIRYYTLDNASYMPWQRVVDALAAFRGEKHPLKEVPMGAFLDAVRQDPSSPAFEVVEYLEELLVTSPVPPLDATQARCAAGDLLDCEIGDDLVRTYVQYACGKCLHCGK